MREWVEYSTAYCREASLSLLSWAVTPHPNPQATTLRRVASHPHPHPITSHRSPLSLTLSLTLTLTLALAPHISPSPSPSLLALAPHIAPSPPPSHLTLTPTLTQASEPSLAHKLAGGQTDEVAAPEAAPSARDPREIARDHREAEYRRAALAAAR